MPLPGPQTEMQKTSAFPVCAQRTRGQNPEGSDMWEMCPTIGATESLLSLCPPLVFPESSAVFTYLHGTNTTPQIVAPCYSDSFSPSHTNTAPVQSKWETPFIKCVQGLGRAAGAECSLCPQKGRGALGKVEADFNQDKQKALGSCPVSGRGGIKEQGFQCPVKCRQSPLTNFPCLPPYTG